MRRLTGAELADIRARCAGLPERDALIEGGRWMCEYHVLHWTSEDVRDALGKAQNRAKFGTKTKRR